MVRAAKNFRNVAIIIIKMITQFNKVRKNKGKTSLNFREIMFQKHLV